MKVVGEKEEVGGWGGVRGGEREREGEREGGGDMEGKGEREREKGGGTERKSETQRHTACWKPLDRHQHQTQTPQLSATADSAPDVRPLLARPDPLSPRTQVTQSTGKQLQTLRHSGHFVRETCRTC